MRPLRSEMSGADCKPAKPAQAIYDQAARVNCQATRLPQKESDTYF